VKHSFIYLAYILKTQTHVAYCRIGQVIKSFETESPRCAISYAMLWSLGELKSHLCREMKSNTLQSIKRFQQTGYIYTRVGLSFPQGIFMVF